MCMSGAGGVMTRKGAAINKRKQVSSMATGTGAEAPGKQVQGSTISGLQPLECLQCVSVPLYSFEFCQQYSLVPHRERDLGNWSFVPQREVGVQLIRHSSVRLFFQVQGRIQCSRREKRAHGMSWKGASAGLYGGGSGAHLRLRYSPKVVEDGQRPLQWAVLLTSQCLHREPWLPEELKSCLQC